MMNPASLATFRGPSLACASQTAGVLAPRKYLRVLPTRTRPSLFGD
jgi:hypothetical protein